ncbi:unnamed protein product [Ranitomeya imitator]|uniref:Uncharacterized protein n=1 Tax=Ranitomeya imitator TaxID=111125 RepID=A0ABN9MEN6_9NEOB|nr:unnamed protein product [Ranitomeya imitator]
MLVLQSWCAAQEDRDPRLLQLALDCLIAITHILHGSSPDRRRVEIRYILDCYFKVLNCDRPLCSPETAPGSHWEEGLLALRINMLRAIPQMLDCSDRPVLQAIFLSNNCFEHIIRLIQNSKLYLSSGLRPEESGSDLTTRLLTEPDIMKVIDSDSDAIHR